MGVKNEMRTVNIYCNQRYILELKHSWWFAEDRLLVARLRWASLKGGRLAKVYLVLFPGSDIHGGLGT